MCVKTFNSISINQGNGSRGKTKSVFTLATVHTEKIEEKYALDPKVTLFSF